MFRISNKSKSFSPAANILAEWEVSVVDLFLNAAQSMGLPKSLGQIYGLLFCRDESLSMIDIMELLSISKGSASQGLRALRQLGAVNSVFARDDRDDLESTKRGLKRENILSGWHRQMSRLLPWVKMIVGKSDRLPKKSSD